MSENNVKLEQQSAQLSDDQLDNVSGGLSDRHREELYDGLGNKGLSDRHHEELHEGLGNKTYEDDQESLREQFGNG